MRIRYCLFLLLGMWGLALPADKEHITITVFVHGSILPPLATMSPVGVYFNSLGKGSWYVKALQKVRSHEQLKEDQVLLEQGLKKISTDVLERFYTTSLRQSEQACAAAIITPAYTIAAQSVSRKRGDHAYYAFGHLGLLSESFRKKTGYQLYHALAQEVAYYKQHYKQVTVTIVAHSHGGNCALYMADAAQEEQQDFSVDELVLLGVPIQKETAVFAYSSFFDRVYNIASVGDHLQHADFFSIPSGKTYRYFSDISTDSAHASAHTVYDITLSVNGDAQRVNHKNFWLLGRSKKATVYLDPLPIVVLTPLIVDQVRAAQLEGSAVQVDLEESLAQLVITVTERGRTVRKKEYTELFLKLCQMRDLAVAQWRPENTTRDILFRYNGGAFIQEQLGYWTWLYSFMIYKTIRYISRFL